jgi:poly-gamma-glutamate synthesis protein (capsule biosynthesis protein)
LLFSCAKEAAPETPDAESPAGPDILTIVAAGDNLYHDTMIRLPEGGAYNFEPFYSEIRAFVEPADLAFVNQETLLAGNDFGLSGYPQFNTPQEVGRTLIAAGFDVINHATNHVMDKGEEAVFATMDFWDSIPEAVYLGIHRSEEERNKPVIIEKNNIKTGFLAYTYGTNGIPVPRDKPYLVSLIDTGVMAREIDALRPRCDFLIVSMHWGNEYEHGYSKSQEDLSGFLAEHGVDLVIGHHPHVIQPYAEIPRPDGGTLYCFYSLGNFISSQTRTSTLLGGLMYVRLKKDAAGLAPERIGVIPTLTHYEADFTGFKVYPLSAYTGELAAKHGKKQYDNAISADYFTALAEKIFDGRIIPHNPFYEADP